MKLPLKQRCVLRASEVLLVAVIRSPLKLTHSQRGLQDLGSLSKSKGRSVV